MPFIPCLNTSTIRPAPLSEKIRLAGEAGFRAIGPMIAALRETGYQGPLSLELFNAEYWSQDPGTVIRTGFEKSRRFWE